MQFLKEENPIDFGEFGKLFPREARILQNFQDQDWIFQIESNQIKLLHGEYKPIFIDIKTELQKHTVYFQKHSFYQENLAKALGIKKGKKRESFCDATGGMLSDAMMMLCFDIQYLDIYERHPLAAVLIANALSQVQVKADFHFASAAKINQSYQVIFFDPMYEDKNLKSAPKKEMQIFRELIGNDEDSKQVALHLRSLATERLVIKRPIKSAPLLADFSHQIKGKSTRYDVYMNV